MPSSQCINKALIGLGATELVLGVGIFGCGVICTVEKSRLHELYHGLWGGAIFAVIGLLAILGGAKESRGCQLGHMILVILACVFLNPTLSTLFMGELSDDAFFTYHQDPEYCQQGCTPYSSEDFSLSGYSSSGSGSGSFGSGSSSGGVSSLYDLPGCESKMWKTFCHPNDKAAKAETAALMGLFLLFVFNVVSSCLACCSVCRCCGANDGPRGQAAIYPTGAYPGYGGPGMASPYNGYGYQPMGHGGYGRPGGVHVPIYPELAPEDKGPYRPPSNYLGAGSDTPMPQPAKPQQKMLGEQVEQAAASAYARQPPPAPQALPPIADQQRPQSAEAMSALSAAAAGQGDAVAPRPGTPAAPE